MVQRVHGAWNHPVDGWAPLEGVALPLLTVEGEVPDRAPQVEGLKRSRSGLVDGAAPGGDPGGGVATIGRDGVWILPEDVLAHPHLRGLVPLAQVLGQGGCEGDATPGDLSLAIQPRGGRATWRSRRG
jgi:hypothetical protein